MTTAALWCEEHDELFADDEGCPALGPWESDLHPCPIDHDNLKKPCWTCGDTGMVDRGDWAGCQGPHRRLVQA